MGLSSPFPQLLSLSFSLSSDVSGSSLPLSFFGCLCFGPTFPLPMFVFSRDFLPDIEAGIPGTFFLGGGFNFATFLSRRQLGPCGNIPNNTGGCFLKEKPLWSKGSRVRQATSGPLLPTLFLSAGMRAVWEMERGGKRSLPPPAPLRSAGWGEEGGDAAGRCVERRGGGETGNDLLRAEGT